MFQLWQTRPLCSGLPGTEKGHQSHDRGGVERGRERTAGGGYVAPDQPENREVCAGCGFSENRQVTPRICSVNRYADLEVAPTVPKDLVISWFQGKLAEKKIEKNENMEKSKKVNNIKVKIEKEDPIDTVVRFILGGPSSSRLGGRQPMLNSLGTRNKLPVSVLEKPLSENRERQLRRSGTNAYELIMTVTLKTLQEKKRMDVKALLDSGATGLFIDKKFVKEHGLRTHKLDIPIKVFNADGTQNLSGQITHEVNIVMRYKGHSEITVFKVCDLGKTSLIIGYTWLKRHNPSIDWTTDEVKLDRCPGDCGMHQVHLNKPKWGGHLVKGIMEKDLKSVEEVYRLIKSLKVEEKTNKKLLRELVPFVYHRYLTVFEKEASKWIPIRKL